MEVYCANTLQAVWNGLTKLGQCDAQSIFTTLAESLLPKELRIRWEDETISTREVPPVQQLIQFLKKRSTQPQYEDKLHYSQPPPEKKPGKQKPAAMRGSVHTAVGQAQPAQLTASKAESKPSSGGKGSNDRFKSQSHGLCHYNCPLCQDKHYAYSCRIFRDKTPAQKKDFAVTHSLCFRCLKPGHTPKECRNFRVCQACQGPHNTFLHEVLSGTKPATVAGTVNTVVSTSANNLNRNKLLMTCQAMATGPTGKTMPIRMLLDSGADISSVTTRVANHLKLKRMGPPVLVETYGGKEEQAVRSAEFSITSLVNKDWRLALTVLVTDKIIGVQPRQDASVVKAMAEKEGWVLADPQFDQPERIDVLLGADALPYCQTSQGSTNPIMATETVFGHALSGTYLNTEPVSIVKAAIQTVTEAVVPVMTADEMLNATLSRFWTLEENPKMQPPLSQEEIRVKEHYASTYVFSSNAGRFEVCLPRKLNPPLLGNSRAIALNRYYNNERSLIKKGQWQPFQKVVQEFLDLNHARPVTQAELQLPTNEVFDLPMHGVHKASSSTTKLRVVFDASCGSSSGVSLNDTLSVGPMLHPTLEQILLRFRVFRVALTGDIGKMYREILLAPADKQLHRFLWRPELDEPIREFCMNRVTFGVTCSPYLAVQTLQQAGQMFGAEFPEAQHHINTSFYVDDLLAGADSEGGAVELYKQLTSVLSQAGFTLRKFRSSSAKVLSQIPKELVEPLPQKEMVDCHSDSYQKTLGIIWDSANDTMATDVVQQSEFVPTKRGILSNVSTYSAG